MTPREVSGGHSFAKIDAGHTATLALDMNGYLYGWGSHGNGIGSNANTPTSVSPTETWLDISAGDQQSCGILTNGDAYCWGINNYGELGIGSVDDSLTPTKLISSASDWLQISSGKTVTCGIRAFGNAWCWGSASFAGLIGNGSDSSINMYIPVEVAD